MIILTVSQHPNSIFKYIFKFIWRWWYRQWNCPKIPAKFSNRFSNVFGSDDIDGGTVQTCLLNDVATSLVWCSGICFPGSRTSKATSCPSFAIFLRFNRTISFLAYGLRKVFFASQMHLILDFKAVILKRCIFKYIRQEHSSSVKDNGQYYDEGKVQLRRLYDKPSCLPETAILVQIHKYKSTNIQVYKCKYKYTNTNRQI